MSVLSATLRAELIVAGVVPQSSCNLRPSAPARICSSSPAGLAELPFPRKPKLSGSSSVAYASSKGGVHGLSLVLRGQLEPLGIRVNCVCPGGINSPLKLRVIEADAVNKRETDEERAAEVARQAESLGDPIGVGKVLAFLASDDADYVRGTIFVR